MKKNSNGQQRPQQSNIIGIDVFLNGHVDTAHPEIPPYFAGTVREKKSQQTTKYIVDHECVQPKEDGWYVVEALEELQARNENGYAEVSCRILAKLPNFKENVNVQFMYSEKEGAWQGRTQTEDGLTVIWKLAPEDAVHMGVKHPTNRPGRTVAPVRQIYRTTDGSFRVVLCELVISGRAKRRHGKEVAPKVNSKPDTTPATTAPAATEGVIPTPVASTEAPETAVTTA